MSAETEIEVTGMKMKRFASALLLLALCVALVGCGKGSYEDGYAAGLAAAHTAVPETEAPKAETPETETSEAKTGESHP